MSSNQPFTNFCYNKNVQKSVQKVQKRVHINNAALRLQNNLLSILCGKRKKKKRKENMNSQCHGPTDNK